MQTATVPATEDAQERVDNTATTTLYVCLTCKTAPGLEVAPDATDGTHPADEVRPGQRLFDALERAIAAAEVEGDVEIVGVECLSNCKRSCTIALASEGRWTYVYGDMHPDESVDDILEGARLYAASSDGIVPWRERPVIFRKNVIARIPSLRRIVASRGLSS
jgi:predicted metal-binding protein